MERIMACALLAVLVAGCVQPSAPGGAAKDLATAERYKNLLLEIDHPPGRGPSPDALAALEVAIREATGKASVTSRLEASIPNDAGTYTWDRIRELESKHRSTRTAGDTASLYVLYVNGGSEADDDDARVLGAHYAADSIVLFKGNIAASSCQGGLGLVCTAPEERYVERAVLVHEYGHAAGLVGLGAPIQPGHEDPDHPGHSANPESVMYWAIENSQGLLNTFTRGADIPYTFDEKDRAALRALREG